MTTIMLSATPKGNGYQGTISYSYGVSISSEETYPTIAEAVTAAALKLLSMPDRLDRLDRDGAPSGKLPVLMDDAEGDDPETAARVP